MRQGSAKDIVAGALIGVVGLSISVKAGLSYDLGSLRRMGPGMFPFGLGLLLAGLGAMTCLSGLTGPGGSVEVRLRPTAAVLGGIACFALLIAPFGLIPAIMGVVLVSSLGERRFEPVTSLLLGAALVALAVVIFRIGLRLPIELFDWPFQWN